MSVSSVSSVRVFGRAWFNRCICWFTVRGVEYDFDIPRFVDGRHLSINDAVRRFFGEDWHSTVVLPQESGVPHVGFSVNLRPGWWRSHFRNVED